MEANTPEKIYIHSNIENRTWLIGKFDLDAVEYIRAYAFIKKACDFLEGNIEEENCKIGSSEWTELRAEYKSLDSFIRAFIKYMKVEEI